MALRIDATAPGESEHSMSTSDADRHHPAHQPAKPGGSGSAGPARRATAAPPDGSVGVPRSRTGVAWLAACSAAVLAIALIIFMLQNTTSVEVTFLWMTATTSLALMLLIAAVGGIVVTLILGSARIIQLRHVVRKKNARRPAAQPDRTRTPEPRDREQP